MCDRVSIIRDGELVYEGAVNDLRDDRPSFRFEVSPKEVFQEVMSRFSGEMSIGNRWVFPEETVIGEVVAALVQAGVEVSEVTPVRRSLEDVYLEHSREALA